ncbi:MAG: PQQ-binding-like beta-propeller repeat protein [Bacteroidales bacterium]|jgi:outer membrane protein assembly factor BamB
MKISIGIIILAASLFYAADRTTIYEWRGEGRTGIFPESNLLKEWPSEGPEELFTVEKIGNGFVTPIFTDKFFYITGEVDSMMVLYCYNLAGEKQWQTILGREWMRSFPGTRSAPTIVGNMIYVGSGMGNLYCVNSNTGTVVWAKDIIRDFGGTWPLHGYSEAALVDGDKVFWTPGGKEYNFVALNRFTGDIIWYNKGFGEVSAYNSPKLIELPSRKIIVTFSAYHLMGYDSSTGQLLWSHEQDNYPPDKRLPGYGDTHSNTVLYEDGFIYYVAGDGNCGVKLKLSADGTSITQIWRNKRIDGYMGGIVKIGDYIYGCGSTRPLLYSINTVTGVLVDSLQIGTGAVIAADNMLYYYNQKGDLNLVSYDQGKMSKVSSFRVKKGDMQHFAHPTINKGILYQRHGNVLVAYDIRRK